MSEKVIAELSQSRWAIAVVAIAIYALWIFQRGKTRRMALMCAIINQVDKLPAVEAFFEKTPVSSQFHNTRNKGSEGNFTIIDSFGSLPEITQRLLVIMTSVVLIVVSFLTFVVIMTCWS
jgi:hypothetical protein